MFGTGKMSDIRRRKIKAFLRWKAALKWYDITF